MCGISGIFSNKGILANTIQKSIEVISHRGPDDRGFQIGKNFAFGMCRLSIIDVAHGHQPVTSEDNQIVCVFNGEIYNFLELRRLLELRGYTFKTNSDSEVIIPAYKEFGFDFPKKLQGMFAIALYDVISRKGLLIRDRLGKKPLWYSHKNGELKFSSELKGLFELGVPRIPNLSNFSEYLQFGYINSPRSAYDGISQIPPASYVEYNSTGIQTEQYWSTNDNSNIEIPYEDAKELVHQRLIKSVQDRMISERPIGAFLSGGVDSSLVTGIMSKISTSKVHSFSIGFNDKRYDESSHARRVSEYLGTIHHEKILIPDPNFVIHKLGKVLDQPFADSSIIPTYFLAEFARKEVVVALGGDGGDEVFGGYTRYRATLLLDRLNFLLAISPTPLVARFVSKNPRIEKLLRFSKFSKMSQRYREFQSLIEKSELELIFSEKLNGLAEGDYFDELWNCVGTRNDLRKLQEVDINSYLLGDLLVKADIATMANSLELRSPFLDYKVVELGLSLPARYKIGRTSKRILRDILEEYLPRSIFDRPKMGFGIPRADWLRNELKDVVTELVLTSDFKSRGWFNQVNLKKLIQKHNSGRDMDRFLWPILMLELWAKNWLD